MISMRIAFVLQLVDDFNGKSLTNAGVVFYEGDRVLKPVKKPDGMYAFIEEFAEDSDIKIECVGFHNKVVKVHLSKLDPVNPLIVIRMFGRPGGAFEYRYDLCCGQLKAKKGETFPAEIYATKSKALNLYFKAFREEEDKKIVTFQGFCMEPLIGLNFSIGEGKDKVLFQIAEKLGSNEYRICPINNGSVQIKQGAALSRIYRSVTDNKGNYSIPIDEGVELLEEISLSPASLP